MVIPTYAFDKQTQEKVQNHALPGSVYDAGDLGLASSPTGVVIENRLGPALRIGWDQAKGLHEMLGNALNQSYAPKEEQ